ncbi:ABC transporter ATP-binding protein [Patescibacteria group bacterium]|nr:ABC transporter ATP-binding protein [Patescibacteria group bacterium]
MRNKKLLLIDAKGISKTYFTDGISTPVLKDVSFKIEKGEFIAITGPSGSGKSTLLHIIGFLDDQTKGIYCFDSKCLGDYTEDEIAEVRNSEMGFVFQAFNLLSRTSVLDNVKLPLLYSKIPEKEWENLAMSAIKEVGLEHRLDHTSSQLSGGEKQRVAIARALVSQPKVIFADEPTGNLDSKTGKKILKTLRDLNKKGHTIVLITHDQSIAKSADRIIHMIDGKIDSDKIIKKTKNESAISKSRPLSPKRDEVKKKRK